MRVLYFATFQRPCTDEEIKKDEESRQGNKCDSRFDSIPLSPGRPDRRPVIERFVPVVAVNILDAAAVAKSHAAFEEEVVRIERNSHEVVLL